jgi:hypothetical protein
VFQLRGYCLGTSVFQPRAKVSQPRDQCTSALGLLCHSLGTSVFHLRVYCVSVQVTMVCLRSVAIVSQPRD